MLGRGKIASRAPFGEGWMGRSIGLLGAVVIIGGDTRRRNVIPGTRSEWILDGSIARLVLLISRGKSNLHRWIPSMGCLFEISIVDNDRSSQGGSEPDQSEAWWAI